MGGIILLLLEVGHCMEQRSTTIAPTMKWLIKHFQAYLLGHHFKVHTDNNPLTYFLTLPKMDATKQRWINELVKYDFSLEYQKGKNNTVANALNQIREECLPDAEAEELLETAPTIPGDNTITRVFEEKEEDKQPEKLAPHTMSSAAMKVVFNTLTSGAGRKAEQEYDTGSAAHLKVDAIEVNVRSARVSTQMHVTDWAEARQEGPEIETAMDWCHLDKKKSEPWIRQLTKLKSKLRSHKNTPAGKSLLRNKDKLTLSGGLLYY